MCFLDAWTNLIAAPDTGCPGNAGGQFLLVGREWRGRSPEGLQLLRSPTRIVQLFGRIQTNGVADYPLVHRMQDGITLRTLADWQAGTRTPEPPDWQPSKGNPEPPALQVQGMSTQAFFTRFAKLLVDNPAPASERSLLSRLSRIGITPGHLPRWGLRRRWLVSLGRWISERDMAKELKESRELLRGWSTRPAISRSCGAYYRGGAVRAMVGLLADPPGDTTDFNARVDASGQPLDGRHRYRLHFRPGELPPVNAFWSVTAYGSNEFLIGNPLNRYALGDRDPLVFNPDESLDIWVQVDPPAEDRRKSNWLPVRAGEAFSLTARLYGPRQAAVYGTWGMPSVERLD
jgi:hypothetical protein